MASPAVACGGAPGRKRIAEFQRARILAAVGELVGDRGVSAMTVAHITGRSRVSRRTFYELFDDVGGCVAAAFEHAVEGAAATVVPAYRDAVRSSPEMENSRADTPARDGTTDVWVTQARAGLAALLGFLDAEPAWARLLVVDSLAADRRVLASRMKVVEALVEAVHRGGKSPGGTRPRPARIVAEGAVGAVLTVVHTRLCEPDHMPMTGLLGPLMAMIVLPYRGAEVAARERRRRASRVPHQTPAPALPKALRRIDMRLTYRTLRVLEAIGDLDGGEAGPSSREVADASGISDQGQISKLLWRLAHLGLIANGVERQGRGEPNAWRLTLKGQEVRQAVSEHSSW